MSTANELRLGIVGACARGGDFKAGCAAAGLKIHAVCDLNAADLDRAAKTLGASQAFTDYEKMLDKSGINAVVIGTPMQLHAAQAVMALQRNIHVLCEVTAAISLDECRQLVRAAQASQAVYMMAENYTYMKPNVVIRELVRQGLFGRTYYAEGEYVHELKGLNEITKWRRQWHTGIAGVTYCTHSLGPILQWMPGDRVVQVCCADTDVRHRDPRGDEYAQMTPMMLCKTARGALIKIRVDCLSDRPHSMTNYTLQGVDGCYESSRGGPGERGKIWLRSLSEKMEWTDFESLLTIDELSRRYVPENLRNPPKEALAAGHGGGDYYEIVDFVNACTGKSPCPLGIHEALDLTLPGLVSQQSILQGGAWLDVPDSRDW